MINIPLPFWVMWAIMLLGVITNILKKINKINHETSSDIRWSKVLKQFFNKEWASYGMSVIFTAVLSYSFVYMKQFEKIDNAEVTKWAKWIPLAVIILYVVGLAFDHIIYWLLGKIDRQGSINTDLLNNKKPPEPTP